MSLKLSDNSAGAVRITFDNVGNTEFGQATPNSPLSFQGRPLLDGSNLGQNVARPPAMPRMTGAVTFSGRESSAISCPACAGFGSVSAGGGIARFNSSKTSFVIYSDTDATNQTFTYSIW